MKAPIIDVPAPIIIAESPVMWPGFLLYESRPVLDEATGLYVEAPGVAWLDGFTVRWHELYLGWPGRMVSKPEVN